MSEPDSVTVRTRLSVLGGVLSVELDNWMGLLDSRQHRRGPFLIIGRQCGLALDTALHTTKESVPHLWRVHGGLPQPWYLVRTPHRDEFAIVSAENGMAFGCENLVRDSTCAGYVAEARGTSSALALSSHRGSSRLHHRIRTHWPGPGFLRTQ